MEVARAHNALCFFGGIVNMDLSCNRSIIEFFRALPFCLVIPDYPPGPSWPEIRKELLRLRRDEILEEGVKKSAYQEWESSCLIKNTY
jgi:hypothetical protein